MCNPFGGLGLTGGIVDVGGVYDCLLGIYGAQANESILDIYSEVRRQKFESITNPITIDNFKRLSSNPDTVSESDEFLKTLRILEQDDGKHVEFLKSLNGLKYDFTQHYQRANLPASLNTNKESILAEHVEQLPGVGFD